MARHMSGGMPEMHGTTILSVRKDGKVAIDREAFEAALGWATQAWDAEQTWRSTGCAGCGRTWRTRGTSRPTAASPRWDVC